MDLVTTALHDPVLAVRLGAIQACLSNGWREAEALRRLATDARIGDAKSRLEALRVAQDAYRHPGPVRRIAMGLLQDPDKMVRWEAVDVLGWIRRREAMRGAPPTAEPAGR